MVASLQHQDVGSIPRPVQLVKESGIPAPTAKVATEAHIWSLAQELHMPWGSQKRESKKTNKNTGKDCSAMGTLILCSWALENGTDTLEDNLVVSYETKYTITI